MTDDSRPVEAPMSDTERLAACNDIVEAVEAAEAAYRNDESVQAQEHLAHASGLLAALMRGVA